MFHRKPLETLTSNYLEYVQDYLKGKNDPDAPGHFIEWLHHQVDLHGFVFDGAWYDIGSFESYDEANEDYKVTRARRSRNTSSSFTR